MSKTSGSPVSMAQSEDVWLLIVSVNLELRAALDRIPVFNVLLQTSLKFRNWLEIEHGQKC